MTRNSSVATQSLRGDRLRGVARARCKLLCFPGKSGLLLLCCLASLPAVAQVSIPPQGTPSASSTSCVDVAINDHPALSYDCLNRRMMMTNTVPVQPAVDIDAVTREPGNRQVGQYNFSSLSHRMGANLGHSVIPQRPPPTPNVVLPAPFGTH